MSCAATLALLLSLTAQAAAQDCDTAADQTTMNLCAGEAYRAADAELNARYREIMERLLDDEAARGLLVEAQRAWLAYRDAECALAASGVEGGSIYPMILVTCLTDLTAARSADLAGYLACGEGDLSCPVP